MVGLWRGKQLCLILSDLGVALCVVVCYKGGGLEKFYSLRVRWIPLRRERIATSLRLVGAVCLLRNGESMCWFLDNLGFRPSGFYED